MTHNKYTKYYISLISLIFFLIFFQSPVYARNIVKQNVLILNSYENDNSINPGNESIDWTRQITSAINSEFVNSKKNIDVKIQYLNSGYNFEKKYSQLVYELCKYKFKNTKFDVVITLDNNAFEFLKEYGDTLFPSTPVVFCGVYNFNKSMISEKPFFTGLSKSLDIQSTINMALKLQPRTKQVFIITGKNSKGIIAKNIIEGLVHLYKDKVKFLFSDEENITKLKEKVNNLPKDTIIYFDSNEKTKNNNSNDISIEETVDILFKDINIPMYSTRYVHTSKQSVGGMVTYGKDLGKEVGKLVLRILNGAKVSDIPVTEDSSHGFVFYYDKLKKFNIDTKALPRGSELVSEPYKYYNMSKIQILYAISIVIFIIIIAMIFVIININKRRRAEKLIKELADYDKIKTNFFSNISHELRTPLNLIFSALQVIELKNSPVKEEDKNIEKYTAIMKQNCYRLLRIIGNLIDITKIDSGHFFIHVQNNDIVNVVENIVLEIVSYVERKNISIVFDTEIEERVMAFDTEVMERIILNLLSNSIKFTPSGGEIEVSIYNKVNSVIISVKDNGIGIPTEKQSSIFEKFVQVDKSLSRNREGSGIGLSLVKQLVVIHNGTIELKSTLDKGSEFIVEIPVKLLSEDEKSNEKSIYTKEAKVERIKIEFSDIYD